MPQLCSVVVFFLLLQGSCIPCHIVEVWLLLLLLRSRCLRRLLLCRVCARAGSPPQRSGVKEVLRGCAAWLCLSCRWLWLLPCLWAWWRCLLFWGWSPAAGVGWDRPVSPLGCCCCSASALLGWCCCRWHAPCVVEVGGICCFNSGTVRRPYHPHPRAIHLLEHEGRAGLCKERTPFLPVLWHPR